MPTAKSSSRSFDRTQKIISRSEIESQIAEGRHIIIVEGKVIKADAWLPLHPGGDKALKHMVGRDATDEVNAYVCSYTWMNHRLTTHSLGFIPLKREPS